MARYREKDETDLRWNKIRRSITYEVNRQTADVREEILNKLLAHAWDEYVKALETGTKLELEEKYDTFVKTAMHGIMVTIEHPDAVA